MAVDSDEQFVQIPDVAKATLFSLQTLRIAGSELSAPLADGFERNEDAAFSEKIFNIAETHTETVIEPHGITDNFRWESVSAIAGSDGPHGQSLSVDYPS